ncbi:hypothetical protein PF008_g23812 [Phytophthora fragariae]|uniref:Centrosomal protein of 44 kDa n=1 Tax=Phytophthora fragariae TaxID=53985 RepID=A0A6G0QQP8_9STRA|nr:hypothetical protein PF008_g23812 [Phytophthora fragariae]
MGEEVRNAAERLRKLLRAAQYPQLSALRLEDGSVSDLLRVLHFVLLDSSRAVAQLLVDKGYDLYGKTDARFVESAFRLLRDEFRCFPALSVPQFLSKHFVARRLALVADAAAAVAHKRQELHRQKRRDEAVWSQPQDSSRSRRDVKPTVENHVLPPSAATNHAASILQHLTLQQTGRVRRTSRETPGPSCAVQEYGGSVAPVGVRFASGSGRSTSEESCAGDGVQLDSRVDEEPKSCSCSEDTDKLAKAIGDLTRQISEMSSALMGKMSSVETRIGRLESQMHGIQAAVEDQRAEAESNSTRARIATDNLMARSEGKSVDLADRKRGLDVESPCAWPPQPSVFERY